MEGLPQWQSGPCLPAHAEEWVPGKLIEAIAYTRCVNSQLHWKWICSNHFLGEPKCKNLKHFTVGLVRILREESSSLLHGGHSPCFYCSSSWLVIRACRQWYQRLLWEFSLNFSVLVMELPTSRVSDILWSRDSLFYSFQGCSVQFSLVQSFSCVWLLATPCTTVCQASLSIMNSRSLPKPMSIVLVMPSSHLILCHPLLLLPSIFPSIRVFSNESALPMRWPKYWSFSFNISPSNEHPGLISFKMGWMDLFAVQGTLKSLLQHHSSKVSILWRSAFFTFQLSHPYVTTEKTITLTRRTFVGKVMSLLF